MFSIDGVKISELQKSMIDVEGSKKERKRKRKRKREREEE